MSRVFAAILIISLLGACSGQQQLETVHVGSTPFFGEAAFYVAQEEGFFKEQGLNVVSHSHSAGKESLKKLYRGELDIAHVAELPVAYAMNNAGEYSRYKDISPRIITNMTYNSRMQKVVARKEKGIANPEDLNNKSIGYYKGTTSEYFLDSFLLQYNLPDSSINKVNIDVARHHQMIMEDQIDAVATWEPHATSMLMNMPDKTIYLKSQLDHSTLWLAMASESFIRKNPTIITSYLKALEQAQGYIKNHPAEVQKLMAKKTETSQEVIRRLWDTITYDLSLDEHMLIMLENQQRWLRQKGYVNNSKPAANFVNAIHFNSLQQVAPEAVTIIQ